MALNNARDAPLTFDTSEPLATQFAAIKKKIGDLQRIHDIVTSESERMIMWLLEIEKQKDLRTKWKSGVRAQQTMASTTLFLFSIFSERDVEVRCLNRLV